MQVNLNIYKTCEQFHLQALCDVSSLFMQQMYFLLQIWTPQGAAILFHSWLTNSRKRLACYITATHSCSWCHRHRLTNTKWQCSSLCFHDFQMWIFFNKPDYKIDKTTIPALSVFLIPFLSIGPVILLHLESPLKWYDMVLKYFIHFPQPSALYQSLGKHSVKPLSNKIQSYINVCEFVFLFSMKSLEPLDNFSMWLENDTFNTLD